MNRSYSVALYCCTLLLPLIAAGQAPVVNPAPQAMVATPTPPSVTQAQQGVTSPTSSVTCRWDTGLCTNPLAVSGSFPSVVHITGIPNGIRKLTVYADVHEGGGKTLLKQQDVYGGEAIITVYKWRRFAAMYDTKSAHSWVPPIVGFVLQPILPKTDDSFKDQDYVIVGGHAPELTLDLVDAAEQPAAAMPITIPLRYERWHVESGGFYAFSWARNEELVTSTTTVSGEAKTLVRERRVGDRLGPSTGVTFVFYKSDYPEIGLEFGTATSSGSPTSYYFGLVDRLLGIGDRAALTISGGLSRVGVRRYPGAIPDGPEKGVYDPTDARLTGRTKDLFKPYLAIGFGVSLGGPTSNQASAQH